MQVSPCNGMAREGEEGVEEHSFYFWNDSFALKAVAVLALLERLKVAPKS